MGRTKIAKTSSNDLSTSTSAEILLKLDKMLENLSEIAKTNKEQQIIVGQNSQLIEEIKQLKEIVCNQNKIIVDLISEQSVILKSNLTPGMNSIKYMDQFPLESEEELEDMELEISDETKEAIIATIKNIVGNDGIKKKITSIFDKNLLYNFNVDGKSGKKRLLDYPKLMNLIYKAVYKDNLLSKDGFLKEMRMAVRLVKNQCYKDNHIKRKDKENNEFFDEDINNSLANDDNSGPICKTQNILSFNQL